MCADSFDFVESEMLTKIKCIKSNQLMVSFYSYMHHAVHLYALLSLCCLVHARFGSSVSIIKNPCCRA